MDISVNFYNEAERTLFQAYPKANVLNTMTANNVSISRDELLAYMMFTEQRNRVGFRTYAELQARIQSRLGDIDDYLAFNNGSVQTRYIGNDMLVDFTERIGVGLGLCIVNKIEGLTQADWELIPIGTNRGFDYQISVASNGNSFIQAENKGSAIADNTAKTPTISRHFASIKRKKDDLRAEDANNNIVLFSTVYYGTIGVLDNQNGSTARVWLIDPDVITLDMDPYKFKLIRRLRHYLEEFKDISVKESILTALEKRIVEIEQSNDYRQFDNRPIDIANPYHVRAFMDGEMFAAVDTNEAFGKIFPVEKNGIRYPYLIAYPKALIKMIITQNFEGIVNYSYNPDFINESVQVLMLVGAKEYRRIKLPSIKYVLNEKTGNHEATYFGKVGHDESGRIFGLLDQEQELKQYKPFEGNLD